MKKFGVNLIYDNDEKNYLSCFEPVIENAYFPFNDDYILFSYYNKIKFYNQIRIKKDNNRKHKTKSYQLKVEL